MSELTPEHEALPALAELLPHEPPMMLLDRVVERSDERIVCTASVADAGVFADDGAVPACVCLEYIAQACAAFMGISARSREEPVRPGFLLGCRSLDLEVESLRAGETVEIRVERTSSAAAAASFDGVVMRGDETIARGQVSVIVQDAGG